MCLTLIIIVSSLLAFANTYQSKSHPEKLSVIIDDLIQTLDVFAGSIALLYQSN